MKLEQSFEVAAPLERVWAALIDVEQVAPCLPGAAVTGRNDDGSYAGSFKVKIGPTSAAYSGKLVMEEIDESAHRATMNAAGTDKRGQGGAKATIVSTVTDAGGGQTRVHVDTDYHITGRLARFGRGGMIEEISGKLLTQFAEELQRSLAAGGAGPADDAEVQAAPAPAGDAEPAADAALADDAGPAGGSEPDGPAAPGGDAEPPAAATQVGDAGPEASAAPQPTPPPPPMPPRPVEAEPLDGLSLVRSVLINRAKDNPVPLIAMIVGFLVALRVLRRR